MGRGDTILSGPDVSLLPLLLVLSSVIGAAVGAPPLLLSQPSARSSQLEEGCLSPRNLSPHSFSPRSFSCCEEEREGEGRREAKRGGGAREGFRRGGRRLQEGACFNGCDDRWRRYDDRNRSSPGPVLSNGWSWAPCSLPPVVT